MPNEHPATASGRAASMLRRKALSAGKTALPPSGERSQAARHPAASRAGGVPASPEAAPDWSLGGAPPPAVPAAVEHAAGGSGAAAGSCGCEGSSCRAQARARRARLSRVGRGDAPPPPPSRPPRQGRLDYPPKVALSTTQGAQKISGPVDLPSARVTGTEPGSFLPVSGSQYIAADHPVGWTAAPGKVGHARTPGGSVVSGTQLRSRIAVTGDEAGASVRITGEADPRPEDDVSPPRPQAAFSTLGFQRPAAARGRVLQGMAAGREALRAGSRERQRGSAIEATESGLAITGSLLGRSLRVTGDASGACRQLTGDQYLTPARLQGECGGQGGGTAAGTGTASGRPDPASGGKVALARTWAGQAVTGSRMEHDARVTGQEPGTCALLTGTPYQAASTHAAWCEPEQVDAAAQRLSRRAGARPVTGDLPLGGGSVSGGARGRDQAISGTPYGAPAADPSADSGRAPDPASIDQGFSVRSPMRSAQLRAMGEAVPAERITGAFAVGQGKVTGNLEFLFRQRAAGQAEQAPAHARLTGEGSVSGRKITGDAWTEHGRVTGTEGAWAAGRSPSERGGGEAHAFAGSTRFQKLGKHDEPRQIVTGMVGWSSKSAAKVTLSGGAQG